MEFRIPGSDTYIRVAQRVATVDDQYDIVDFGARHGDGSIDSIAVGGSFSYLKSLARKADENARTGQNVDIAVAQVVNDVPVTEPVLSKEAEVA